MKRLYKFLNFVLKVFIPREKKTALKLGILKKIRMWTKGFYSNKYIFYGLDRNNPKDYLSDYVRATKTYHINGYYKVMLDDKIYFTFLMQKLGHFVPEVYALITKKHVRFFDKANEKRADLTGIVDLIREKGRVVLKPFKGGGGQGILVVGADKSTLTLNGEAISEEQLLATIKGLKADYLAGEFIYQHDYASRIFPHTANTIRAVTMWDDEADAPFLAVATHRFGCAATIPTDNMSQGGVNANVDIQTGELKKLAIVTDKGIIFQEDHPETGEKVTGLFVPHWEKVRDGLLKIAADLKFIPYVGWDVMVTEDAFKIIEGNSYPDMELHQRHGVILDDPKISAFYRNRGVIKR